MHQQDIIIAQELKRKLSVVVELLDFSIFGSRARGTAGEGSDMDVFVKVQDLDKELKKRMQDIAWEVGFENSLVISLLIFTRQELEDSPLRSSPIVRAIEREGLRV